MMENAGNTLTVEINSEKYVGVQKGCANKYFIHDELLHAISSGQSSEWLLPTRRSITSIMTLYPCLGFLEGKLFI